jgi:UDP-N-acetylglucosamine 4-epimerase
LVAAKEEGVSSFTYASSSSIYGDNKHLPKIEDNIGNPLSPYAVTKYANELYAHVFANSYNFNTIGLRYFNVFGKRQDPNGSYAAVIPKWISAMISHEDIEINGDGTTSRDFCFIDNVVQMNILSALSIKDVNNQVFNVAFSEATTLLELFSLIKKILRTNGIDYNLQPIHKDFRHGDVKHSLADISKGKSLLQYEPEYNIEQGLVKTISYYLNNK